LNKNANNFEKDKVAIKQKLINYLDTFDQITRRSLLDIIVFISKYDFPHNFMVLHQYIFNVLESINKNNCEFLNTQTLENLKAVKEVYK
jgi:hypothetical protein